MADFGDNAFKANFMISAQPSLDQFGGDAVLLSKWLFALAMAPADSEEVVEALGRVLALDPSCPLVDSVNGDNGQTALHVCFEKQHVNKAALLSRHGAHLDITDKVN